MSLSDGEAIVEDGSKSTDLPQIAWTLAGAPPPDLPFRAGGTIGGLSPTAFHDRATQAVKEAGFSVGDFPGGPFLRGVIVKSRREIYGHVMGERKLVEVSPPKYASWIPAAALVGGIAGAATTYYELGPGGIPMGLLRDVLSGVSLIFLVAIGYGIARMRRPQRFEGDMLVVEYTAPPPAGSGQEVFERPTQFTVTVSAGRELTTNVSGRGLAGRVIVRGVPSSQELEPFPRKLLARLGEDNPLPTGQPG